MRTATRPLYFSPPRSSVSSAPGRQVATCGMSSKNCHTFSTGSATSKSLLISIVPRSCSHELLHIRARLPLERLAAADPAEGVRDAAVLQLNTVWPGSNGHAADRVNHAGRLRFNRVPLAARSLRARVGDARPGEPARCPQLHELSQDRDGDLLVRCPAKVESGRHPDPRELVLRHAPVGEIAEHRRAPPTRADKANVDGPCCDRALE